MQTPTRSTALAILASFAFAAPAFAQPAACPLPYKVFEFAVAHIDLAACPKSIEGKGAFCRATVGGDAVHVFVFAEDGEQCLRSVSSYESGKFALDIK
jgi:hypothetical protein